MSGREYNINTIRQIREARRIALCGYFLVGYPSPKRFFSAVRSASRLDVLEFGIPSGCPLLDGPTIANAHAVTLGARGLDTETALALTSGLVNLELPKFVMSYAEEIRSYAGFLDTCQRNDIHGVFSPDIDNKEAKGVSLHSHSLGMAFVRFVDLSMTTAEIDSATLQSDILYVRIGTSCTGTTAQLCDAECLQLCEVIRRARLNNPQIIVAGGIGIRHPSQVVNLACMGVDMAVVGMVLVEKIALGAEELSCKVDELRQAAQSVSA